MLLGLLEPPLVGLPVHRDQLMPDARQHACGDTAPGHLRTRTPRRGHRAAEDHLVARLHVELIGQRGRAHMLARHVEEPLDERRLLPRAHPIGVSTLTEQQPETADDHRLTRARLAGDHVEPRAEFERRVGDDTHVANPDFPQHASHPRGTTRRMVIRTRLRTDELFNARVACRASPRPTGRTCARDDP